MTVPVVPLPGATVMLLRDGEPGLEVLLLRRSDRASFVPGAHVFPGGVVDLADHDDRYLAHWSSAEPPLDLGWRVAAAREALEEAGVLLATTADGVPVGADHPLVAEVPELRHRVWRGEADLATVLAPHGLRLTLADMVYVARWVTPEESPRRYDARFYVAPMPPAQEPVADDQEVGQARWWCPRDALDAWQADRILLIEPTVASLELLADFDRVDDALGQLRDQQPREEVG